MLFTIRRLAIVTKPVAARRAQEALDRMMVLLSTLAILTLSVSTATAGTVGFQRVTVSDSDGKPRAVGIWYPSDAPAVPQPLGPYRQTVAIDGALVGRQLVWS